MSVATQPISDTAVDAAALAATPGDACPECGHARALDRDWCPACGYHYRWKVKIELDPWDLATISTTGDNSSPAASPAKLPPALLGLQSAWQMLFNIPGWGWALVCGVALIFALTAAAQIGLHRLEKADLAILVGLVQFSAGWTGFFIGYFICYYRALMGGGNFALLDFFTRPIAIWSYTLRELPRRWYCAAMGLWGMSLAVAAVAFAGLTLRIDWGEEQADWSLSKAISAQKKRASGDIGDTAAALNNNALVRAKQKAAAENRPFSADCVILGYYPAGESGFDGLVLGMDVQGELTYVGTISVGIPPAASSFLTERMPQILRPEPFLPLSMSGVKWLEPKLTCRVKYEKLSDNKKLVRPIIVKMLPEL
ncbi:MAG: hypothetical protein SFX18_19025 [Pirellulales bacterium]|nr:hypothetical protein [Pirellulales bacterium]